MKHADCHRQASGRASRLVLRQVPKLLSGLALLAGTVCVVTASTSMASDTPLTVASSSKLSSYPGAPRLKRDSTVDVPALTQRAYAGNANAQYALASLYEQGGSGVKKDLSYAVSWYEEAAHNGLKVAAEKLKLLSSAP